MADIRKMAATIAAGLSSSAEGCGVMLSQREIDVIAGNALRIARKILRLEAEKDARDGPDNEAHFISWRDSAGNYVIPHYGMTNANMEELGYKPEE